MNTFKASAENTADVESLARALSALSIDETVTYQQLTNLIGRNIQSHYWLLNKARKIVEEETGSLYEVVRNVGIKRLASEDAANVGLSVIGKVRRTATNGIKRLANVRCNDMPAEEANKVLAHRSQLGAIALVADGRKSVTVAKEAAVNGGVVPAGRVLDLFKR